MWEQATSDIPGINSGTNLLYCNNSFMHAVMITLK